ncbi:hypothetical protein ACH6EH_02735 [Paenibacillus sp. JSM ZJ436]|uniref:hypothetical protein n=1 Tax=Paenibacillus sp. JSM ZJ436 TaxID=3376190 RepID=UPI00379FBA0D
MNNRVWPFVLGSFILLFTLQAGSDAYAEELKPAAEGKGQAGHMLSLQRGLSGLKDSVSGVSDSVKKTLSDARNTVEDTGDALEQTLKETASGVEWTVEEAVQGVGETLEPVAELAESTLRNGAGTSSEAVRHTRETVQKVLESAHEPEVIVTETVKAAGKTVRETGKMLSGTVRNGVAAVKETGKGAVNTVEETAENVLRETDKLLSQVKETSVTLIPVKPAQPSKPPAPVKPPEAPEEPEQELPQIPEDASQPERPIFTQSDPAPSDVRADREHSEDKVRLGLNPPKPVAVTGKEREASSRVTEKEEDRPRESTPDTSEKDELQETEENSVDAAAAFQNGAADAFAPKQRQQDSQEVPQVLGMTEAAQDNAGPRVDSGVFLEQTRGNAEAIFDNAFFYKIYSTPLLYAQNAQSTGTAGIGSIGIWLLSFLTDGSPVSSPESSPSAWPGSLYALNSQWIAEPAGLPPQRSPYFAEDYTNSK